jgi:hypothetical protein
MPYTFNGTGTKYLGQRERDMGGTYITTKWVVVLMVPIIPLSSWRVFPLEAEQFHDHMPLVGRDASHSEQSFQATRVPLNWRQVLNTYAVTIAVIGILGYALRNALPSIKF